MQRQTVPNKIHEPRGDNSDVTHKQTGKATSRTSRAVPGCAIISNRDCHLRTKLWRHSQTMLYFGRDNQVVAK